MCRRWWQLVNSPQLLAEVDVSIALWRPAWDAPYFASFLKRIRRLCEWMLKRAAGRVRRLRLHLTVACSRFDALDEVQTAVVAMVVGCGAAGGLRQLSLVLEMPHTLFMLSNWVPALSGLQRLEISTLAPRSASGAAVTQATLGAVGPLHTLTGLEQLSLYGEPLTVSADGWLPARLTSLSAAGFENEAQCAALLNQASADPGPSAGLCACIASMVAGPFSSLISAPPLLPQATRVAGVRRLRLCDTALADHNSLSRLTNLERLALILSKPLAAAAALPLPPSLRELHLSSLPQAGGPSVFSVLQASLAQVPQLSCLILDRVGMHSVPAAAASLARLQRFVWREISSAPSYSPIPNPLPAGPWFQSLTELEAPLSAVASHLSSIGPQLRSLCLLRFGDQSSDPTSQLAALRWAAAQPGLQRLSLHCDNSHFTAKVAFALLHLSRARPSLQIEEGSGLLDSLDSTFTA